MRVIFSAKQVARPQAVSPSASKPSEVLSDWRLANLPLDVIEPLPASIDQLSQAHERRYVERVLAGRKANGFGNNDESVRESLPYTVGAMVTGALEALRNGGAVAAPCSGFHHAHYAKAGGYCTFNGLVVAAVEAHKAGAARVGILDLDMHYGDGTDTIIDRLGYWWIKHYTAGERFLVPGDAPEFFAKLPEILQSFGGCDVLLCQLGADPYLKDPFGGWLTMAELKKRDEIVFETCKHLGLPVVWNLAGGYAKDEYGTIAPVLEIHRNSALACVSVFG